MTDMCDLTNFGNGFITGFFAASVVFVKILEIARDTYKSDKSEKKVNKRLLPNEYDHS